MNSYSRVVERAQPLLGTFVTVRVGGLATIAAHAVVSRAFAEISTLHRLMSFQDAHSDITRLNLEAHLRPVEVHFHTYAVLKKSLDVSTHSDGAFDITVKTPDRKARWTDVELLAGGRVRFARPLTIDVSGIAKGYAVDCAMDLVKDSGATRGCVNAGGDLAAFGTDRERVYVQMPLAGETSLPMVELHNESMATSGTRSATAADHIDGINRRASPSRLVSVVAPRCWVADALTKVVAARGSLSRMTLRHFGATALMSTGRTAWSEIA